MSDVIAAVDLGSNSFHMVVARYSHGQLVIIDRLREMVRLSAGGGMHDGHDYVLIGRRAALLAPFGQMRQELDAALSRIHDPERTTGSARDRSLHHLNSSRPAKRRPPRKPHEH